MLTLTPTAFEETLHDDCSEKRATGWLWFGLESASPVADSAHTPASPGRHHSDATQQSGAWLAEAQNLIIPKLAKHLTTPNVDDRVHEVFLLVYQGYHNFQLARTTTPALFHSDD